MRGTDSRRPFGLNRRVTSAQTNFAPVPSDGGSRNECYFRSGACIRSPTQPSCQGSCF
jgi:hypothetical protein